MGGKEGSDQLGDLRHPIGASAVSAFLTYFPFEEKQLFSHFN